MGFLGMIVMILCLVAFLVFMVSINEKREKSEEYIVTDNEKKEKNERYQKRGYNYKEKFNVYYKGGIKNISVNSPTTVDLLKEGLAVNGVDIEKIILFSNIKDISLQSKIQIEQQVSLGKLILFGGLAFGMEKNNREINIEYIVLNVIDEDGEYNVLLRSFEQNENQENYKKLGTYKDTEHIEKNKIVEINNSQEFNEPQEKNVYKDIEELARLKDKGILTEEEFTEKKKILLDKIK